MQYNNPTQKTIQNSQYLADGSLDPNRLKPNQAGFGAVTGVIEPIDRPGPDPLPVLSTIYGTFARLGAGTMPAPFCQGVSPKD